MWTRIHSIDSLPKMIKVRVDYYRKSDHGKLTEALKKAPNRKIPPSGGDAIEIPTAEFLAYWLFEDKNPDDPLVRDFEALAALASEAIPDLRNNFESTDSTIRARIRKTGQERPPDIPTRLGVAIGLSVVNQIVGLTRADWSKIDKSRSNKRENPRFDYELAATPVGLVALENKGGIVRDNTKKGPAVSKRKREIEECKTSLRPSYEEVPLIGTIGVADSRDDSQLKCWLLDPPMPNPSNLPPEVFRVLNRLRFQRSLVQMILPMSHAVHNAMREREMDILREQSIGSFEGKSLRYPSGGRINLKWKAERKVHAIGKNGLWVGMVTKLKHDRILFAGLGKRWVDAALRQELRFVSEFDGISASGDSKLEWHATGDELAMLSGFEFTRGEVENDLTTVSLPVSLHETMGGFAFAIIEKKEIPPRKIVRVRNR